MTEIIDNKKNELLELRMRVNQSSDEQLEEAMYDEWMHGIIPDAHVSDDALQRIHDQALRRIKTRKLTIRRVIRYMQIAASFSCLYAWSQCSSSIVRISSMLPSQ